MYKKTKTIGFIFAFLVAIINADLNKDRLFLNINNSIPCVRRFNATHQIGCGKLDYTSYNGIVYAVRNKIEFERLDYLNELNKRKIILVVLPNMFAQVVEYYKNDPSGKINGIVLIATPSHSASPILSYSDDSSSPDTIFSVYSNNKTINNFDWNLAGKSFMFEDFKIPFYIITDEKEAKEPFDNCYDKFNKEIFERVDQNVSLSAEKIFQLRSSDLFCGMQLGLGMQLKIERTLNV